MFLKGRETAGLIPLGLQLPSTPSCLGSLAAWYSLRFSAILTLAVWNLSDTTDSSQFRPGHRNHGVHLETNSAGHLRWYFNVSALHYFLCKCFSLPGSQWPCSASSTIRYKTRVIFWSFEPLQGLRSSGPKTLAIASLSHPYWHPNTWLMGSRSWPFTAARGFSS